MPANDPFFHPQEFGALADGVTPDTAAIQQAIEAAHAAGGGTVFFRRGRYLSGSINLRDNVGLHLDRGAVLLGSTNKEDYRRLSDAVPVGGIHAEDWRNIHGYDFFALILAHGVKNISITGEGTIDGQGNIYVPKYDPIYPQEKGNLHTKYRPILINCAESRNIHISGITLKDSSCWTQSYLRCAHVLAENFTVDALSAWNNDGIDIVDTRDVVIRGARINCADDAVCFKSTDRVVENITVSDCVIRCSASAFKCGTGSGQGFRNINVNNLSIYDTARSAVALEVVDGGTMELINISNITMRNSGNAIFIRIGDRARLNQQHQNPGVLRDVTISNVTAEITGFDCDAGYPFPAPRPEPRPNPLPSSITGQPGAKIQNLTLSNFNLIYIGDATKPEAVVAKEAVPECPEVYPEYDQFGELPAWGLYVRHVEGLTLRDWRLQHRGKDPRPAIVYDDVRGLREEGVEVSVS